MSVEQAQLARYGEVVARLARPLADRAAVLWLVRLDAAGFAALEAACTAAIERDPEAAATFGRAFARAHTQLSAEPALGEHPRRGPTTRVEGAGAGGAPLTQTLALQAPDDATLAGDAATLIRGAATAAPTPDDTFTMASVTHAVTPRPRADPEPSDD